MPSAIQTDWRKDFGVDQRKPPAFFADAADLDAAGGSVPQVHVLKRAFEDLKINGVLCQDGNPLIYFRLMERIEPKPVFEIHRTFWNQGVAPILVLIAPDEVHVYSGLSSPALHLQPDQKPGGCVEKLRRVARRTAGISPVS